MGDDEDRAVTSQIGRLHGAAHRLGKRLDDGKPQAAVAAAFEARATLVGTIEAIEEMLGVTRRRSPAHHP